MVKLACAMVLALCGSAWAADQVEQIDESSTAVVCLSFANELNVPVAATHLTAAVRTAYGTPVGSQIDVAAPSNPYCWDVPPADNAPPAGVKRPSSFARVVDWSWTWGSGRQKTRTAQWSVIVHRFPPPTPAPTP